MPHPPKEHEKTDETSDYQNEEEDPPTSLDDWERAVEGWFYEIMKGK